MTNKKPDAINMDLIRMVQQARMEHDATAKPSQVPAVYWIEAKNLVDHPPPTPQSGEWQIQTDVDSVDILWGKIKIATENGSLGHKSKVSTAPGKGQAHLHQRIICVRTVDGTDETDKQRVYQHLIELGISPTNLSYEFDHPEHNL